MSACHGSLRLDQPCLPNKSFEISSDTWWCKIRFDAPHGISSSVHAFSTPRSHFLCVSARARIVHQGNNIGNFYCWVSLIDDSLVVIDRLIDRIMAIFEDIVTEPCSTACVICLSKSKIFHKDRFVSCLQLSINQFWSEIFVVVANQIKEKQMKDPWPKALQG